MQRVIPMSASSKPNSSLSEWGRRAADLYAPDYARRYRAADDEILDGPLVRRFGTWLGDICDGFGRDIAALDLGCGTGRYFSALRHVRELVGIDVSPAMLAQAAAPVDAGRINIGKLTLIEGDFLTASLPAADFDLVYSIGVLGEHVPFDPPIAARVRQWLRRDGRFAFTTVHRESFSVPRTPKRRAAELLLPLSPAAIAGSLRDRLLSGGLYVDEHYLETVLHGAGFVLESLDRYESDVHLHCLCVARKTGQ
jgi:SAM-dependent methyltransferase